MDWDKLRIFHAVAEAGSFTEAGDILNLSQSAVSRQISTLESSLGIVLFHRHARGLILTEQGEILSRTAADIMEKINIAEGKLSDTSTQAEGPLVVTVSHFIGTTWLTPRLKKFRDTNPNIHLTVMFDESIVNVGMREADAAIRLHAPKHSDIIAPKIATINFHICASKEYLETRGTPHTIEELSKHSIIAFPPNTHSSVREPGWLITLAKVKKNSSNVLLMNSVYAISKAVRNNMGIAVLPDYLINSYDNIVKIMPNHKRPPIDMFYVYAEERRNSKRIKAFKDFLREMIEDTQF